MPRTLAGVSADTLLSGLAAAKEDKRTEINAAFDVAAASLIAAYPAQEQLTFDQQASEAAAYLADTSAACPLLSAMASARGITLEALCQRVLAKREAFSAAAGSLLGQRQSLDDLLDACDTVADVQALTVEFALPPAG